MSPFNEQHHQEFTRQLVTLVRELSESIQNIDPNSKLTPSTRVHMLEIARSINNILQPPEDYVITTAFQINVLTCIRTCSELGVFELLDSAAPRSLSASEIATSVNAEELLIVRFMRGVCSMNFATEEGVNTYIANNVTHAMANPGLAAGFCLTYDNAARPKSNLWSHMEYFRRNGYQCPSDAHDSPYQHANDCVGITSFEHWMKTPQESLRFNNFMKTNRGSRPNWYEWMNPTDIKSMFISEASSADDVLLVDVAGGHGHDVQGFLQAFGESFPGRIVLQDLPDVIETIEPNSLSERIIKQKHDFFQRQPVCGAKAYFMHMIMHDWPDSDCIKILCNLRDAMKPGYSYILINDAILPDKKCPSIATAFDITMMAHHAGIERSELMWRRLIDNVAGLQIAKIWHAPEGEGIVQLIRTDTCRL